jgi:hypothetical protein
MDENSGGGLERKARPVAATPAIEIMDPMPTQR